MFLKSVPFWIFTGFGVTGTVTPVSYVVGTSPFFKTMWQRSVSLTKPALRCTSGSQSLGFYLSPPQDAGGGQDTQEKRKITLKVVGELKGQVLNKEKNKFFVTYSSAGKGSMLFRAKGQDGHTPTFRNFDCSESIISIDAGTEGGGEVWIDDSGVYGMFFEQSARDCKRQHMSNIECNIELQENKNLKWKEGHSPKVIYSAF